MTAGSINTEVIGDYDVNNIIWNKLICNLIRKIQYIFDTIYKCVSKNRERDWLQTFSAVLIKVKPVKHESDSVGVGFVIIV